jgi:hypothetical protein
MKGPGHRHRFDVRRIWECPVCKRRVLTSGRIVHLECDCSRTNTPPQQVWMRLVEDVPRLPPSEVAEDMAPAQAAETTTPPPPAAPDSGDGAPVPA